MHALDVGDLLEGGGGRGIPLGVLFADAALRDRLEVQLLILAELRRQTKR